jgi:uncharacterized membrane protein
MISQQTVRTNRVGAMATYAVVSILSATALLPFLNKSIWRDEGASLYSARLSWLGLWHQSLVVDRVLLFYYALLHLWLEPSSSIQWARAPSVLSYALIIFLTGVLANRIAGFWCGLIAAIITCTNPLLITAALEARSYAVATLVSLLSIVCLTRWCDHGKLLWLWVFCFLAIVTLVLQLFLVLAPLSVLAVYLVVKPEIFRRQWRELLAPIGLLAAGILVFFALVAHQQGQVDWIPGLASKLLQDLQGPASPSFGHFIYPFVIGAIGLIAVAGCIVGWSRHSLQLSRFEVDRLTVCLGWAVLPTAVLILITAVKPVYVGRYVTASVPGMGIALALLITFALRALSWSRASRTFTYGAMVAVVVILIANSVSVARWQLESLKGATEYIVRDADSTSAVALPDHAITAGVEYYLDRRDSPLRLWPQLSTQPYIEGLDLRQGASTFKTTPNNVWLVDDGSVRGTKGFILNLERHGFTRVKEVPFNGVNVLHFRHS